MRGKNISGANITVGFNALMDGSLTEALGSYEARKVGMYYNAGVLIDTVYTTDTKVYETAVFNSRYSNKWIVVDEYATKEDAQIGHDKWVNEVINNAPDTLYDVIIDKEFSINA